MATKEVKSWTSVLFILAGLVIGGLLGEFASKVDALSWLNFGKEFGLESPILLDLNIIKLTFAIMIKINIASIIGIAIGLFLFRKL